MKPWLYVPDDWAYAVPFKPIFDLTSDPKQANVIMFTGGCDITPQVYGETRKSSYLQQPDQSRDRREIDLFKWGRKNNKKFIGICRGAQLLCCLAGGALAQHITGHHGDHTLTTSDGDYIKTSSDHHQMMLIKGTKHELLAWTEKLSKEYLDGDDQPIKGIETEPEVVYFPEIGGLAIQGHPEYLNSKDDSNVYYRRQVLEKLM